MTSRFPPPREQLGTKRSAQAGERAHGGRGRALRTTWRALAVTAPSGAHSKRPGWATAPGGWSGAGSVRAPRRRWGKPGSRALRSLFSSPMLLAFFPPFLLVRRRIGWLLPALSLALPGAGVRLVSAREGEEQTWRCRKVCSAGRAAGRGDGCVLGSFL